MIHIRKADQNDVHGIAKVCKEGYWATYRDTHSKDYIKRVIEEFYNYDRILNEVTHTSREWGGYFVAFEGNVVIGAGGGGMIDESSGEVFVLYLDPNRRNEGIGTRLLEAITKQQKEMYQASCQWVSVSKGNQKGIPFYEAKGFVFVHEQSGYANEENEPYISLRYYRPI